MQHRRAEFKNIKCVCQELMFDILICQKLAECDSDALIKVNLSPGMGCENNINWSVHKYVHKYAIICLCMGMVVDLWSEEN